MMSDLSHELSQDIRFLDLKVKSQRLGYILQVRSDGLITMGTKSRLDEIRILTLQISHDIDQSLAEIANRLVKIRGEGYTEYH